MNFIFICLMAASRFAIASTDSFPASGFYNNAEETPIYKILENAQKTLDIEIYQMNDPDVRADLHHALERKTPLKIRVVKEPNPLGDHCLVFEKIRNSDSASCMDQKQLRAEIIAKGGSYIPFNKNAYCPDSNEPCFEHGKMIIADHKTLLISTGNFNSSNLCNTKYHPDKCNRDFTVIEHDPKLVLFFENIFENDVAMKPYNLKKILEAPAARQVTVSPYSLNPLVQLISHAKKSIRIENQYMKDYDLNAALFAARKRGVKVEMTLASLCSFGRPKASQAKKLSRLFETYEHEGILVSLFTSKIKIKNYPGYLHAKAIVVDDTQAWVGSVNGSHTATSKNREFGLFFSNPAWVSALDKILESDFHSPNAETWQESLKCEKDEVSYAGEE